MKMTKLSESPIWKTYKDASAELLSKSSESEIEEPIIPTNNQFGHADAACFPTSLLCPQTDNSVYAQRAKIVSLQFALPYRLATKPKY